MRSAESQLQLPDPVESFPLPFRFHIRSEMQKLDRSGLLDTMLVRYCVVSATQGRQRPSFTPLHILHTDLG